MQRPDSVQRELDQRGAVARLIERFQAAPAGIQALAGVMGLVLVGGLVALATSLGGGDQADIAVGEAPEDVAASDGDADASADTGRGEAEEDPDADALPDAEEVDAESPDADGSAQADEAGTDGGQSPDTGGGESSSSSEGGAEESAAATPGCEGVDLRATDRGVTEDEILIGVLVPKLGALSEAGFDAGLDVDHDPIMDAWLAELNRDGGVACRQVRDVRVGFDVLDVDSMQAACRELTQDHEVFAVVTSGGYDSVAQRCIAEDNRTPLLNPDAQPASWYEDAAPYLWTTFMNKDRMHRNHMRWLVESGTLEVGGEGGALGSEVDGGHTVGVIYHGIPNVGPSVENSLLPELERLGVEPAEVIRLSSDDEQALAQINNAVLQMRRSGVDFVIFPMNLIFKTQFMQVAEQQNYYPEYTDSDHYFGCMDFVTETYPAESFDGTTCVTVTFSGMQEEEVMQSYPAQREYRDYARKVFEREHPDGYGGDGRDEQEAEEMEGIHMSMGTFLLLWAEAAERVGPEQLTREAWGHEMGETARFEKTITSPYLTFSHDKWDGPEELAVARWHADAGDGYEERLFRQIQGFFDAFF